MIQFSLVALTVAQSEPSRRPSVSRPESLSIIATTLTTFCGGDKYLGTWL